MKIQLEKTDKKRTFTLKLSDTLCIQLDALGEKCGLSRQKLIESILTQAVSDKSFVLRVKS